MLPKVTIFGRPNVGKSTLFNRIAKRKAAIVENISGVTRDSVSLRIVRNELEFILYDSAGFYASNHRKKLNQDIFENLSLIIKGSDIVIFLLDARTGISPLDHSCAEFLRKNSICFTHSTEAHSKEMSLIDQESPNIITLKWLIS